MVNASALAMPLCGSAGARLFTPEAQRAGTWQEILDSGQLGVANGIAQLDKSGKLTTTQIPQIVPRNITGVLEASQIPDLDASKITTGVFVVDRVPDLDAAKIATGALATDRIPTLAQSKISGLTAALERKVETSVKINGHPLEADIKLQTADIVAEVTELPEEGVIGEVVAYGGKLYVWSGDK